MLIELTEHKKHMKEHKKRKAITRRADGFAADHSGNINCLSLYYLKDGAFQEKAHLFPNS